MQRTNPSFTRIYFSIPKILCNPAYVHVTSCTPRYAPVLGSVLRRDASCPQWQDYIAPEQQVLCIDVEQYAPGVAAECAVTSGRDHVFVRQAEAVQLAQVQGREDCEDRVQGWVAKTLFKNNDLLKTRGQSLPLKTCGRIKLGGSEISELVTRKDLNEVVIESKQKDVMDKKIWRRLGTEVYQYSTTSLVINIKKNVI